MSKFQRTGNAGRKSRGGTLLGIFVGLVLGVLISFGVVWVLNKSPLPFQDKTGRVERPANGSAANGSAAGTPTPLPGKPGDKVAEKPRFDFYKILPGGQEPGATPSAQPATEGKPAAEAKPAADAKPAAAAEPMFLQVGAFQKLADADNLKAKLALMGLEAGVQDVDVPDKGKMYRVRVGPLTGIEEMNRMRGQLSQNGIQATPVKAK